MASEHASAAPVEGHLPPEAEVEWSRLRRQLELARGFWLGFLFAASPPAARALELRSERLLRARGLVLLRLSPASPEEVPALLDALLRQTGAAVGCLWLEAIRVDSPGSPPRWAPALEDLLLRLNERREVLRRQLAGGLVLALAPGFKPRVRDLAPDLWSIRSLVVELPLRKPEPVTTVAPPLHPALLSEQLGRHFRVASDPAMALAEARRLQSLPGADPRTVGSVLVRAAEGFLARGQAQEALSAAREATEILESAPPGAPFLLATALAALSEAEASAGDSAAAAEHVERAVKVAQEAATPAPLEWFELAGELANTRGDLGSALRWYQEMLRQARARAAASETPQALRDVSVSLVKLADVRRELGDLAAAQAAYEDALAIDRRLLEAYGETPQALRDVSVSLGRLGDVRLRLGDLAAAQAAYEEALAIQRRLLEAYGETPQVLRDVSVSLGKLADVRLELGDLAAARAAYEEALAIDRRLLEAYGRRP